MATVLLTWELGLGIGHLMNLRPIGQELLRRGHRVVAAVRQLARAREILGGGIHCIDIPMAVPPGKYPFDPPMGYAHMLGNMGFINEAALSALFARWNAIFDDVQPALVVADHSPSALFSLWGRPIPRVNIGLAFFCPPDRFPLPSWPRKDSSIDVGRQVIRDEQQITVTANRVLHKHGRPQLARLSQFFAQIDEVFLATYPEFDHFGQRPGARYWGHWPFGAEVQPEWPAGHGPKIYSYLNPSANLESLLTILGSSSHPTIVVPAGIDPAIMARHTCSTLRFQSAPVDMRQVVAECDFAITNAGHGTVATLLLGAKPCLLLPLSVEQLIFAQCVEKTGAGRLTLAQSQAELQTAVTDFLCAEKYKYCAQRFAKRYVYSELGQQIPKIVDRLERLLTRHEK